MTDSIRIESPNTAAAFAARDLLLASTMRDAPLLWSYSAEYPLVLADTPQAASTSLCAFSGEVVIAHINVWPRQLVQASTQKIETIALVGNVASHADHRGQGHIRKLLTHAAETASLQGANAMILWSDLLEFYQNLGFTSNGRETRYVISRSDRSVQTDLRKVGTADLSDDLLAAMLDLRPKFEWNLSRSTAEFRALLSIPECYLFVRTRGRQVLSWFVIGKGSDMAGVIHEWGAPSPEELLVDLQSLMHSYDIVELTLLAPGSLRGHWHKTFATRAKSSSTHSMALAKALNPAGEMTLGHLARGFIWGLDSI